MNLTYRALRDLLQSMPDDQLDNDVSVRDCERDEYFSVTSYDLATDGVLDDNHLFLSFNEILSKEK